MAISYCKLWKLLIDKRMSKADLRHEAEIAPNTMTKLNKEQPVSLDVLCRICEVLSVDFADIVEYVPEEKKPERRGR